MIMIKYILNPWKTQRANDGLGAEDALRKVGLVIKPAC